MKTFINIIITISIIGIINIDVIDIHVTQILVHAVSALDTGRLKLCSTYQIKPFWLLLILLLIW